MICARYVISIWCPTEVLQARSKFMIRMDVIFLINVYVSDLQTAVNNKKMYFITCQKEKIPIPEEDIDDYLLLYSAWLAAQKAALSYINKLDADRGYIFIRNQILAIYNEYTVTMYLKLCKDEVQEAINNGAVKAPEKVEDTSNPSTVTEEESTASIQEKFRQIQMKYPPNQGVAFMGTYGGCTQCYGFARLVFNKLFDCDMPAAYYNAKRYEYVNNNNVVLIGQLEGLQIDVGFLLEGVEEHHHNGQHIEDADEGEQAGAQPVQTSLFPHYCCTSLERVALSWSRPMPTTSTKNTTALAWPTPSQPVRP